MNTTTLTRLVMALAVLLSLVAVFLVVTKRTPSQMRAERVGECKSVVMVASGDTLSKLLLEQGLSHNDVNAVAQVLKANADITTLRADRDKLEFVRESDVVIPQILTAYFCLLKRNFVDFLQLLTGEVKVVCHSEIFKNLFGL